MMAEACNWPDGVCRHYQKEQLKPDAFGRVWMHCDQGLSMGNKSLAGFMKFCLANNVEIGSVWAFNPRYNRSLVIASVRLKPDQFSSFEAQTGGTLRTPPKLNLNCDPSA